MHLAPWWRNRVRVQITTIPYIRVSRGFVFCFVFDDEIYEHYDADDEHDDSDDDARYRPVLRRFRSFQWAFVVTFFVFVFYLEEDGKKE